MQPDFWFLLDFWAGLRHGSFRSAITRRACSVDITRLPENSRVVAIAITL